MRTQWSAYPGALYEHRAAPVRATHGLGLHLVFFVSRVSGLGRHPHVESLENGPQRQPPVPIFNVIHLPDSLPQLAM